MPVSEREEFGVCVKGLSVLDDQSLKIAEWIEILKVLGASKIYLPILSVHENIHRVLEHYVEEGRVELSDLTLAGGQPNDPWKQHKFIHKTAHHIVKNNNEKIPLNVCFYQNLYR